MLPIRSRRSADPSLVICLHVANVAPLLLSRPASMLACDHFETTGTCSVAQYSCSVTFAPALPASADQRPMFQRSPHAYAIPVAPAGRAIRVLFDSIPLPSAFSTLSPARTMTAMLRMVPALLFLMAALCETVAPRKQPAASLHIRILMPSFSRPGSRLRRRRTKLHLRQTSLARHPSYAGSQPHLPHRSKLHNILYRSQGTSPKQSRWGSLPGLLRTPWLNQRAGWRPTHSGQGSLQGFLNQRTGRNCQQTVLSNSNRFHRRRK